MNLNYEICSMGYEELGILNKLVKAVITHMVALSCWDRLHHAYSF